MHFRFLTVPIFIDKSFWVSLLLSVGVMGGSYRTNILVACIFTLSLFVREYGHAIVALYFNAQPVIILQAFGGRTAFNSAALTDKQKLLVILAGYLLQGSLTLITYILLHFTQGYLGYLLCLTTYINMIWLLLHLIPILPLDGGWLMRYLLQKKFGHKGYRASIVIGLLAASIAIPYLYLHKHYLFVTQLFLSGLYYCKLWHKDH